MKEIERDYYGNDEHAINKHSTRTYEHEGKKYVLNRNLSGVPPFYSLNLIPKKDGIMPTIKVNGKEYWGDGWSWSKAVAAAKEVITGQEMSKFQNKGVSR